MKATIKIATIAVMGIGLGVKAQNFTSPISVSTSSDAIATFQTTDDKWLYTQWKNSSGQRKAYMGFDSTLTNFILGLENGAEKISFPNGNVGIGTRFPSAKLDVNGRLRMRSGIDFGSDANGYGSEGMISWSSANAFIVKSRLNKALHLGANNINSHLSINTNGYVGIGTTKPDMKLTVKGNIHAEEVKIDLNVPAPDYVFKENYNLRSIEEVENFIKENSHLPEIPSAKEFEQNGVMQAEMDMNLLKKIEELTLYTINQEKKLKSQKDKFEKQQKEIEELKKQNAEIKNLVQKLLKDKN